MKPLVIFGSSGHASSVINTLRIQNIYNPVAALSIDAVGISDIDGVPILGDDSNLKPLLAQHSTLHAIIGIGENNVRARLVEEIQTKYPCIVFATVIHPSAIIAPDVKIGAGTFISASVVINHGVSIGAHVILNTAAVIEHHVSVAGFAFIGPNAAIAGHVRVGRSSFVGIGATIIPNIDVGDHATIGAGAVVIRDVSPNTKVVGNPAQKTP